MKKIFMFFVLLALTFTGCAENGGYGGEPVIHEIDSVDFDEFLERIIEIHMNPERYFGDAFRYQGFFLSSDAFDGTMRHFVLQFSGHCCGGGGGGNMGFEVVLDDTGPFPDGTWVEVTGILSQCETSGFLYLQTVSVTEVQEPERPWES